MSEYQYEVFTHKNNKSFFKANEIYWNFDILFRLRNDDEAKKLGDILDCVIFIKRLVLNLRLKKNTTYKFFFIILIHLYTEKVKYQMRDL